MKNPKGELQRRKNLFLESGDADKAARLESMAYQLFTLGNTFQEEADAIFNKYGLVRYDLKHVTNELAKAFNMYDRTLAELIRTDETREAMCDDYQELEKMCRKFMNIE